MEIKWTRYFADHPYVGNAHRHPSLLSHTGVKLEGNGENASGRSNFPKGFMKNVKMFSIDVMVFLKKKMCIFWSNA